MPLALLRPVIRNIGLVHEGPLDVRPIEREFPSVRISRSDGEQAIERWDEAQRFDEFDALVEDATEDRLVVHGDVRVAIEVLTRYQRFLDRRNDASRGAIFDVVLKTHRVLHDLSKPLVKADYDHAIDTWQWVLRLDGHASQVVQLAALFHDIERLESEADARIEHHAADYQGFKDAHALFGAERTFDILVAAGVDVRIADRVRTIVSRHEKRRGDREIDLLNDADALSFFSLNVSGYLDYFGPAQTLKKVRWTLDRLSPEARTRLDTIRLRPDVRPFLEEACAA